jgi:hypothetical protein
MTGPEATVESYLKTSVEAADGVCIKIKASGVKGVPDRIVTMNGLTVFVELKSKSGKLSIHQQGIYRKITAAGGFVFVLDSKDAVDNFMVFMLQDEDEPTIWTPGMLDS